jgi:hypothetical protein
MPGLRFLTCRKSDSYKLKLGYLFFTFSLSKFYNLMFFKHALAI